MQSFIFLIRYNNFIYLLQKYNINVQPVEKLHYCFKLLDHTLEHRINVLKDIGVPVINTSLLNK